MNRVATVAIAVWISLIVACASAPARGPDAEPRPERWAQPVELAGVPNLHKISADLYRSAQPSAEGMKNLELKLGIRTVVNLRLLHSDRDELAGTGLSYAHIPIRTWKLEKKHVLKFFKIIIDPARRPVLVHCQHGADRTGTMAAFYRMIIEGWDKDAAIEEMTAGGFNYHAIWKNLLEFIREADIPAYRAELALPDPGEPKGEKPNEPKGEKAKGEKAKAHE